MGDYQGYLFDLKKIEVCLTCSMGYWADCDQKGLSICDKCRTRMLRSSVVGMKVQGPARAGATSERPQVGQVAYVSQECQKQDEQRLQQH